VFLVPLWQNDADFFQKHREHKEALTFSGDFSRLIQLLAHYSHNNPDFLHRKDRPLYIVAVATAKSEF
jgi:hypothetical protein